jgi:sugar lactone lactonase YvrE
VRGPADGPDGCAIAASGNIYLALVGASNQIVELSASGQELARFGQQYSGANNSSVPFDSPSGVAFLGTKLIIANQSYFAGNPSNQALLALETGEAGLPVFVPGEAASSSPAPVGVQPAPARHHHARKHHKRRHHGRRHRHR